MGRRRFVWIQGSPEFSGLKFLLRTGRSSPLPSDNYDAWEWFVGGDRSTPTPINKSALGGGQWEPLSIVATGPGLDDWIVCAVDGRGAGANVAFLDVTGVLKVDNLPIPPVNGAIVTSTTGNFANRVEFDDGTSTAFWSTVDDDGGGDLMGSGFDPSQGYYLLPDVARNAGPGIISRNIKRQAVANLSLTYSLSSPGSDSQVLYRANGTRTTLPTTIIPDPAAGVTGGDATLQMFSQACSLVNLVLWRWTGLTATNIEDDTTAVATLTADRWQIYDDATWNYLERLPITYQRNEGLVRVDMSGWPPIPEP